ncbi:MAG: hypothetical protein QM541_06245 [Flavobacterium sp.]|nr:hypothetical protein [Flavobacterium sp.]
MCFSAIASFSAGTVLTTAGIITTQKVSSKLQLAFAAIPLLFGIQQLSEGFVWLSLTHQQYAHWQQAATHAFLFFAHALWPVWVPFAALLLETKQPKKTILFGFFMLGLLLSLGEIYCLSAYHVESRIYGKHIEYLITYPRPFVAVSEIVYVIVTLVPCFVSSFKNMRWFAIVLATALVLTGIFYQAWLISVWCFFAALLSVIIYRILALKNKKQLQAA